jgi:hypothetical protein
LFDHEVTVSDFDSAAWFVDLSREDLPLKVRVFMQALQSRMAGAPWWRARLRCRSGRSCDVMNAAVLPLGASDRAEPRAAALKVLGQGNPTNLDNIHSVQLVATTSTPVSVYLKIKGAGRGARPQHR